MVTMRIEVESNIAIAGAGSAPIKGNDACSVIALVSVLTWRTFLVKLP